MRLLFRVRTRIALLSGMVVAGFVLVGARRLEWPLPMRIMAMTAAMIAVIALLARWARSGDDFDE
jgi:hypothetical protein